MMGNVGFIVLETPNDRILREPIVEPFSRTLSQSGLLFQNKHQNSNSEQLCVIGLELVTWEEMPSGV